MGTVRVAPAGGHRQEAAGVLDRRGRLLLATVSAASLPLPDEPAVRALHDWLDTWRGIGDLEAGMARQGTISSSRATRTRLGGLRSTSPAANARRTRRLGVHGSGRHGAR